MVQINYMLGLFLKCFISAQRHNVHIFKGHGGNDEMDMGKADLSSDLWSMYNSSNGKEACNRRGMWESKLTMTHHNV